jgi:NAD(P)-dependent dehydrogenase (short-subunit alcohol dehydrogenase family)
MPSVDTFADIPINDRPDPVCPRPDEYWDKVLETNLSAQFVLTRELGRDMVARGRGKIIFIASLLSFQGGVNVPGYAASKGGIGQLTKAFANEWAGRGVNVNAIAPGYAATDNTQALRDDPVRSQLRVAGILERRLFGPEGIDPRCTAELVCRMQGLILHAHYRSARGWDAGKGQGREARNTGDRRRW